jgi:Holliday junction resolvase-like predicted endonuclease
VLHAPRQTGKTTFLQSWVREINSGDDCVACYVSVEDCQGITEVEKAMPTLHRAVCDFAQMSGIPIPHIDEAAPPGLLRATLIKWAELLAPKPLVVLFDEVDVLAGDVMVSFLRQLRGGFAGRGVGTFPISIALVGMRDIKDYLIEAKGGQFPGRFSPFNIKADSASLSNFTKEDIIRLFAQRTEETGQQIVPEALDYVYEQSKGQPWIVNLLFMRATMRVLNEGSNELVTLDHVQQARKQIVESRETHLDSLGERLNDPRVKRVIQAIITGDADFPLGRQDRDVELVLDLGLITYSSDAGFVIANPLYEEVLIRHLNSAYHDSAPSPSSWRWQKADGTLDMDALLREFQDFWQTHSEMWEQTANYTEAFPHLLLMAFLQRVTNGHGRIEREYASGSGRMDLAVEFKGKWNIVEIKMRRHKQTIELVKTKGLEQILRYRDRFPSAEGCYLVIFDRRAEAKELPWAQRIWWERDEKTQVTVVGC